jgi:ethanolamine utilization protein EutA (predicted chaperonin)
MPTIELTDEQAEQLREVVADEIDWLRTDPDTTQDVYAAEARHRLAILSALLHLLEIA